MAGPISFSQATSAYEQQLKLLNSMADGENTTTNSGAAGGGSTFADMLGGTIKGGIEAQYKAEHLQMQALSGKTELSDLVTAVTNAELTLDTIVAVRDKVISAYQAIIAMPI